MRVVDVETVFLTSGISFFPPYGSIELVISPPFLFCLCRRNILNPVFLPEDSFLFFGEERLKGCPPPSSPLLESTCQDLKEISLCPPINPCGTRERFFSFLRLSFFLLGREIYFAPSERAGRDIFSPFSLGFWLCI